MNASAPAKRALVVYESMFGNTRELAEAVGEGLSDHLAADVRGVGSMPDIDGYDLVVAGGPTHDFSLSRRSTRAEAFLEGAEALPDVGLREWLESLPVYRNGPLFATFDTRAGGLPGSAARKAARMARARGYQVIAAESYWVLGTHGPLVFGELGSARSWARRLADTVVGSNAALTAS